MKETYYQKREISQLKKLRELQKELPPICTDFFNAKAEKFEVQTRVSYARDLRIFFRYLLQDGFIQAKEIRQITNKEIAKVTPEKIDDFLAYVTYYEAADGSMRRNTERGKQRKLATLNTFYQYLKKRNISDNPASLVDNPKIHDKDILILNKEELNLIMDEIKNKSHLSPKSREIHEDTELRDRAIIGLFLGTGLRVSEVVGINLEDLFFDDEQSYVSVTRKGGSRDHVYFNDRTKGYLLEYLEGSPGMKGSRSSFQPAPGENALFISRKHNRIAVRSVQHLLNTLSKAIFGEDSNVKLTPHTLRRAYGTFLYGQMGDILAVSKTLGHRSIETTQRSYVRYPEEMRQKVSKFDIL